jgi:hypothetical protein
LTMSFVNWDLLKSHRIQLAAVAILSTGITASAIFAGQRYSRRARIKELKESISDVDGKNAQLVCDLLFYMSQIH